MNKHIVALVIAVFHCASSNAKQIDVSKNVRKTSTITWEHVKDVNKACAAEFAKIGEKLPYSMDACAIWNGNHCKIITTRRPTADDIGHEVLHCFQEHFHSLN